MCFNMRFRWGSVAIVAALGFLWFCVGGQAVLAVGSVGAVSRGGGGSGGVAAVADDWDRGGRVASDVAFKAYAFALSDVRLLDGPFKTAQDLHAKYMLDMDADRLLYNFRINAGLSSSAKPWGNWERPASELRGHLTGHYLSACALMYASTGDVRFKERGAAVVRGLGECQKALGSSGYLSAFPETFFDRLESTGRVWAPYYTIHKIMAGLIDQYNLCGNAEALDIVVGMGNWVVARTDRLSDEKLQRVLNVEHGGINESMARLYALTGQEKFLRTAERLCHKAVLDPLAEGQDRLAGLHANTQFPKVIGTARLYELTGQGRYRKITEFFWDRVVNHHSYITGGNSDHEHFGPPDRLYDQVSPFTAETCNTYNMLKLTRHVFAWDALATEADYYERALYNHILPSQDPRTGRMAYHVPVYGGWFMPYNTPYNSAWCCTGTGLENHAKYGDSIYWHDDEGLFVNLYIPSELKWAERSVVVRQETRYPEEDTARLTVHCSQDVKMNVRLRYPGWAQRGMEVKVNGAVFEHGGKPGSFVGVERTWRDGDTIEVRIPMDLRLVAMPDNNTRAAICYGPVVLAGELGTEGIVPPMPYAVGQGDYFNVKPPAMPVLVTGGRDVGEWVEPVEGKPLTFRTKGVGRPRDITLVAFYRLRPQRYSLYWDVLTDAQWKERQAKEEEKARRERELAAETVDSAGVGNAAIERAHNVKGENTNSGTFSNRHYRHARDGGWFSYDLKAPAGEKVKLLCTFWGSDAGSRVFDIIVNGQRIATRRPNRDRPGEFFDVVYNLPEDVAAGGGTITVKFAAHPGQMAGGVFDVRLVKASYKP